MRRILTLLAAGTLALSACSDDSVGPPTDYVFVVVPNQTDFSLSQDDSALVSVMVVDTISGGHMYSPKLQWTSDDSSVATIESAGDEGWRIRANGGGTTQIHVVFVTSKGPVESTIDVSVQAIPIETFEFDDNSIYQYPGDVDSLDITLEDVDGNDITLRRIRWENSNDSVATVTSDGVITALAVGTTTITATAEGKVETVTVTVSPRPVHSITVTPDIVALHQGDTLTVVATLKASNGEILEGRNITWTTDDKYVARVDTNGVVTAYGRGDAKITAKSGYKQASVTIYVDGQDRHPHHGGGHGGR